jgi:hypothetical protein
MKKLQIIIVCLFICFFLSGCAYSKISSFTDPNWELREFQKILVYIPFDDFSVQIAAEDSLVNKLQEKNVNATPFYKVFPPTKECSGEYFADKVLENGFDGMITVAVTDYYTNTFTIPETTETTGEITSFGGPRTNISATTTKSGGQTFSTPNVIFEIELFDLNIIDVVWIANSHTTGNAFAKSKDIFSSLSDKLVDKLQEDGIIIK